MLYLFIYICDDSQCTSIKVISCLKWFLSRRGYVNMFISDNFSVFRSNRVANFLRLNDLKWKYILSLSPWWGGFYEHLIRIMKRTVWKVLGNAKLNYEELLTVLMEIERVVNSRPISYRYNDEITETLTPSHLLIGRNIHSEVNNADSTCDEFNLNKNCVRRG